MKKILIGVLALSIFRSIPAQAEYSPLSTTQGKLITVGVCLPKTVKSPVYLQTWSDSFSERETIAKITFTKLSKHKDCNFWSGVPGFQGTSIKDVGERSYRLTYKLKVSFIGERILNFYSPSLDVSFDGWPDGIKSNKSSSAKSKVKSENLILNQPATSFFIPGTSLVSLQQVWGIKLYDSSGPRTLRQVTDDIYIYLNSSVGRKVTQLDLEIGFQPGNSMQSFFSRLTDNIFAYQAIKDRLIYNSNR